MASDNWKYGLIKLLKNQNNILMQSETMNYEKDYKNICAVIKDVYPKATFHFLVLPLDEDLDSIYDLRKDHLDLLDEFEMLSVNIVEAIGNKTENFSRGFHTRPSMKRLHLHVISKDFKSPCLKNKKHWNSFTTDFLVPVDRVRSDLLKYGYVLEPSDEIVQNYLNTPLKCNTCSYSPKHIPDLKKHLLTHVSKYIDKDSQFISLFEKNG